MLGLARSIYEQTSRLSLARHENPTTTLMIIRNPIFVEFFEEFHGQPAEPWGSKEFVDPTEVFANPITLDLLISSEALRFPEFGINSGWVQTIARDDIELERQLRQSYSAHSEFPVLSDVDQTSVLSSIRSSGIRDLPYVETILGIGHFLCPCPDTGQSLKSTGSFVVDPHHIAYRFEGRFVFYLLVGRFHGRRAALCVPAKNLLITLDVPERGLPITQWVAQTMRRLISYSFTHPVEFRNRVHSLPKELTIVVGGMGNFGHHVWQELSGIAMAVEAGQLHSVKSMLVGPHTWFDIAAVFPEIAPDIIVKCTAADEMFIEAFDQPGTLLRPIGVQITKNLRDRLRHAAEIKLGSREVLRILSEGKRARLIWINLRFHNKMWNSQVEGYAALLNTLQNEFGDIGVVYDGWKDTCETRNQIDSLIHKNVIRHDTIGASIESSLIWAEAVTTYVSVIGSGLVLNSWLVERPGIAHANRAHLRQRQFWNSVSQGMIPTSFIDQQLVTDDGSLYGNYDFDWKHLLDPVRSAISNRCDSSA